MKYIQIWSMLENWLFNYPQKIEIDIHYSLTSSLVLIIWRVIAFLALSFRYILSILEYESAFTIVQYLTEVSFTLTWVYFIAAIEDYCLNGKKKKLSKLLKGWINLLFEVAICIEVVVTILFWLVLYDYTQKFQTVSFLKQVGVHGFPFLCLMIDLFFNIYPFPKRHLIAVVFVGLLYLALNIAYSLAIEPIYPPLDWVSLMCYLYIVGSLLLVFGFHTLIRKYWQKCRKPKLILLQSQSQSIMDDYIQ